MGSARGTAHNLLLSILYKLTLRLHIKARNDVPFFVLCETNETNGPAAILPLPLLPGKQKANLKNLADEGRRPMNLAWLGRLAPL